MVKRKPWALHEWKERRSELVQGKSCEWCGSKENLVAHHPQRRNTLRNEAYMSLEGTMILCNRCHLALHRGMRLCPNCHKKYTRHRLCVDCYSEIHSSLESKELEELEAEDNEDIDEIGRVRNQESVPLCDRVGGDG